jgi:hypothetical protein
LFTDKEQSMPRTLVEPDTGDKRYVHSSKSGQFTEQVNVGRSLSAEHARSPRPWRRKATATGATGGHVDPGVFFVHPMPPQADLWASPPAGLPAGFRYQPDLISKEEERRLADQIAGLPLKEFEFQGADIAKDECSAPP